MPIPSKHGLHRRSLLRDHVYESIRDAIVDGTLVPGERLRDGELEEWLGVSRTPIREALLRLERAGLVIAQPGKATTVAPYDEASTVNAQQVVAAMHELAARLAVPLVGAMDIQAMARANAEFADALQRQDVDRALAADDQLHGVLVAACGNAAVAAVLEQWTPVLRRVERNRFGSLAARNSVQQHARIISCAEAGDAEGAARASRENWLSLSYSEES
ncbi:GntR family transcriptional regulator [Arthrobacter crystallopoietes BAB-32]|uniref:GntR family transcriptional regulator n=1 Tax=Arthrobacter crystallopoietes BAB-32 TaxID=1246476 RepID=N1UZZ1_9MICC|nr:GntR family transcriptional regulator [Arthrobacter crystallopoietes]EMY34630.1 GntR family transcriptional regulator [Arthrobacter crystallopoietes BAB-32]